MQFTFADSCEHVINSGRHKGRRIQAVHDQLGQNGLQELVSLYHLLANLGPMCSHGDHETCRALSVYLAHERIHKQICELSQAKKRQPQRVDWAKVRASIPAAL